MTSLPELPIGHKDPVRLATAAALPAHTLSGYTLTASSNAALTVDGVAVAVNDRILVKDEVANPLQHGIYKVTAAGAAGAVWVLDRTFDAYYPAHFAKGMRIPVQLGTANAGTAWRYNGIASPTIGTTSLYFVRELPSYTLGDARSLWAPTGALLETLPRNEVNVGTFATTSGTMYLTGGIVLPAGLAITNVNVVPTTAGATYTVKWFSLVRQSDRAHLRTTANSTAVLTANVVNTIALSSAYTAAVDTPVWIGFGISATTMPQFTAYNAAVAALSLIAPPYAGASSTGITATPPSDGAIATAITVGGTNIAYAFLS